MTWILHKRDYNEGVWGDVCRHNELYKVHSWITQSFRKYVHLSSSQNNAFITVSEVRGKVSNWEVLRSGVKKSCHLYSYIFRPIDLVLIRLECQYEEILHKIRTMIVPKWNCDRILLFHFCLLIPLYPVLNKLMNIFSLSFLNASSGERIFSRMITCMSLTQCPLRLKWAPVAWSSILFRT